LFYPLAAVLGKFPLLNSSLEIDADELQQEGEAAAAAALAGQGRLEGFKNGIDLPSGS